VIIRVDPTAATPPYAQIRAQVATMVRSGVLAPGVRLPSIRHLANDLGIAANTVARAYRELEHEGLVASRGRHGTVVLAPAAIEAETAGTVLAEAATAYAIEASHRGLDLDQALDAVRSAFRSLDEPRRLT
jgi:DNA-binding transcriptional regulator YhcF (GntR family)